MYKMTFDINGNEGTCRTKMLAGTAPDTFLYVNGWYHTALFILRIHRNHRNRT